MVNYDEEFAKLLQNSGHLIPFMDSFFGFLYRRTDFFCIKNDDSEAESKFGFSQGSAEKILLAVFRRWEAHANNERDNSAKLKSGQVPDVAHEVEVGSEQKVEPIPNVTERLLSDEEATQKMTTTFRKDESESFNGADLGHYKWSQSSTDLDVTILVDATIKKGSQIQVNVTKDFVKVLTKEGQILLEGALYDQVRSNETVWNLTPGKCVTLSLEKSKEKWWTKFLNSEETPIKAEELQIEQSVDRMTTSDKMAIEEAMHRQQAQLRQQEQLESALREAWNKEGSPFQGQPFDPSVLSNFSKSNHD